MWLFAESFVKEEACQSELVKRLLVSEEVSEPFLSEHTLEPPSGSPKHINIDQSRMMVMVDEDICSHVSNVQIEKGCIMESTGCQEGASWQRIQPSDFIILRFSQASPHRRVRRHSGSAGHTRQLLKGKTPFRWNHLKAKVKVGRDEMRWAVSFADAQTQLRVKAI